MFLNVPLIAPEVPARLSFGSADPRLCHLALAMGDSGLLPDAMLDGVEVKDFDYTSLRGLLTRAWESGLGAAFAFEVLAIHLVVAFPRGEDVFEDGDRDDCMAHVVCAQPRWINVKPAIQLLEDHAPRLGARALELIDCVLSRLGIPFTPSGAAWMASMCYWFGEQDETLALEEAGEEYADDIPRRADLFEGIPEWVHDFKPTANEREHRRHFRASRTAPVAVRRLVSALEALRVAYLASREDMLGGPEEYEYCDPAVVLQWDNHESLSRIFDDHWQSAMQSETAPFALGASHATDAAGISELLRRVRNTGRVFKALDAVLVEVATHEAGSDQP